MMEFSSESARNLGLKGEDVLFLQCEGSFLGFDELRRILQNVAFYIGHIKGTPVYNLKMLPLDILLS